MATFEYLIVLLATAAAFGLLMASFLFMVAKNKWDQKYELHRRRWMPHFCSPCASLWLTLPLSLAGAALFHPGMGLAFLLVPPFYNLTKLQ